MNTSIQHNIRFTRTLIAGVAAAIATAAHAQDFHLSQYDEFALYLNPALTGVYKRQEADYRIAAGYRSQWKVLSLKPFATYGLAYDMRLKNKFAVGGYVIDDKAGPSAFNTLNVQISGSYFITDPDKSAHKLTAGLQAGCFYKSFRPDEILFESQYDNSTGTLNADIASGENFEKTSLVKFDANLGMFYTYNDDGKKYSPFIGVSVFHLSRPSESFSAEKEKLPMRFSVQAGSGFEISDKVVLTPSIFYMTQAKASEMNLGMDGTYMIKEKTDILYGLHYRIKDAVIVHIGMKKDNLVFRMSYDVNTSYLSAYTSHRGAFELSLIVYGKKHENPFHSVASF